MNNSADDRWISLSDILRAVWSLIALLEGIRLPHLLTSVCICLCVPTFISAYLITFLIDYKQKTFLHLLYLGHKGGLSLRDILSLREAWWLFIIHICAYTLYIIPWICGCVCLRWANLICVLVVKSSVPLWLKFPSCDVRLSGSMIQLGVLRVYELTGPFLCFSFLILLYFSALQSLQSSFSLYVLIIYRKAWKIYKRFLRVNGFETLQAPNCLCEHSHSWSQHEIVVGFSFLLWCVYRSETAS